MNASIISTALANRSCLYEYLWCLLAVSPDKAVLDLCANPETAALVELTCPQGAEGFQAQTRLAELAKTTDADTLKTEQTKLFVGPGALPSAPWESVHTSVDGLLFQESTLAVRNSYKSAGFVSSTYPHEPDDALATELDFMRALTVAAMGQVENGNLKQACILLKHQRLFLEEHLNAWVGKFAQGLEERKPASVGDFYLEAARLVMWVCREDAAILDELIQVCESLAQGME